MKYGSGLRQRFPMRGVAEIGEQLIEESIEAVELAEPLEAAAHEAVPPFALEAADFSGLAVRTEGQPRRRGECAAKTGTDRAVIRIKSVLPRDARVGVADRLARLE